MAKLTVLFVDDDQSMLNVYKRSFVLEDDYTLLFAQSGSAALDLLQKQRVDIVASDICMPGMSGLELVQAVHERYPQIVSLLISGQPTLKAYDVSAMVRAIHNGDIFKFVAKSSDVQQATKEAIKEAAEHIARQNELSPTLAEKT